MDSVVIVLIVIILPIFFAISEFFGRSKHIGRWWSFALLSSFFVFGIIALIASPSAKNQPTKGNKYHKIFGWVILVLGILNIITLNPSGLTASPAFIILGLYLLNMSQGKIQNENPKFYFDKNYNNWFSNNTRSSSKNTKKNKSVNNPNQTKEHQKEVLSYEKKLQTLKELHEQDILTSEEYYEKLAKLKHEKLQKKVKETDEYKKLKSLYENGILTKEEFESKTSKIIKQDLERNSISEKGLQRIKKLVFEQLNYEDYQRIESNFNKDNEVNKTLRYKLEKILRIKTHLTDKKFIELIIKFSNEKFDKNFKHQNNDYRIAGELSEGYFLITDPNLNYGFAKENKQVIIKPVYDHAESFREGLALVRLNKRFGFIDKNGHVVIDLIYDNALSFKNGRSFVELNNTRYYINKQGKIL